MELDVLSETLRTPAPSGEERQPAIPRRTHRRPDPAACSKHAMLCRSCRFAAPSGQGGKCQVDTLPESSLEGPGT